eukprot:5121025-Prymnesium_polylepis.1
MTYWASGITRILVDESIAAALAPSEGFSTIGEAAEQNIRVCAQPHLAGGLIAATTKPAYGEFWDPRRVSSVVVSLNASDTPANILESVQRGTCGAAILEQGDMRSAVSGSAEQKFCGFRILGPPIMDPVPIAFPVNSALEPLMSFML